MRSAKSRWQIVCLVACSTMFAMDLTMGVAQEATQKSSAGDRAIRRKPHSYFQSFENAKRSNTSFEVPDELIPDRGQFELTLTRNRFRSRHAGDVLEVIGIDGQIPETFEVLCYNGKRVGPTIRVKRGSKFKIRVKNALHGKLDPGAATIKPTAESAHGLCTTNLHTHGLHVSPSGNSDNIFWQIEPGEEFTFEYEIGPKHPSGTFWYHPHKHGSTAYQLSNGVSGALIVEGTRDDGIDDLEDIREIREAAEKIVVLQWYSFGTFPDPITNQTIGFIDAQSIYNVIDKKLVTCESIRPDSNQVKRGSKDNPWNALAVNGIFNPKFEIAPGEVQRWRVIHAGWDVQQQFAWYKDDGTPTPKPTTDIQFWEIALDGLATGRKDPLTTDNPQRAARKWQIAPGQRSDILIKAPILEEGATATYYLMIPDQVASEFQDPAIPLTHVAKLVVCGKAKPMALPHAKELERCAPFEPVQDSEIVPATIPDPTPGTLLFKSSDQDSIYTINGKTFHTLAPNPIPLQLGTAQEWILKAAPFTESNSGHPFHIHVNPFQVISGQDNHNNNIDIPKNTWRDTLYIERGYTYTIRSRYTDIEGLSVLHCHILDHEDQGMMRTINLSRKKLPAAVPPGGKGASNSGVLTPVATRAPTLKLPDTSGTDRDLAEFKGCKVALVFFQGDCFHCAEQLRDLVGTARGALGGDAEIVAVSSQPIADAADALRALGVTQADKFHLLVDKTSRSFRDFGCYDGRAQHGLFLIDQAGVIRSRYVGETPFDDTQQVIQRLKKLARSDRLASP
jgi:FtsP/CotA-like multicopper oxidase with cupredoxin domain/peroxiredoxin